jgi:hypothetical protein
MNKKDAEAPVDGKQEASTSSPLEIQFDCLAVDEAKFCSEGCNSQNKGGIASFRSRVAAILDASHNYWFPVESSSQSFLLSSSASTHLMYRSNYVAYDGEYIMGCTEVQGFTCVKGFNQFIVKGSPLVGSGIGEVEPVAENEDVPTEEADASSGEEETTTTVVAEELVVEGEEEEEEAPESTDEFTNVEPEIIESEEPSIVA